MSMRKLTGKHRPTKRYPLTMRVADMTEDDAAMSLEHRLWGKAAPTAADQTLRTALLTWMNAKAV